MRDMGAARQQGAVRRVATTARCQRSFEHDEVHNLNRVGAEHIAVEPRNGSIADPFV